VFGISHGGGSGQNREARMPDLKEALTIFFERFNAAVTVWNLQLTVILGLIAFLAVASSVMQNKLLRGGLIVGYLMLAIANLLTLEKIEAQRRTLAEFVVSRLKGSDLAAMASTVGAPSPMAVALLHLAADIIAVLAIWFIPSVSRHPH
jgi:hypothetical protein